MSRNEKRIYLDFASTTPVDKRVVKEMEKYWSKDFGNPGSIHAEGLTAKKAVDPARTRIARLLESHADEIIFTGSGTEANNLAIFGTTEDVSKKHFITSVIEHSSVLECFKELERRGGKVDYISVNEEGLVDLAELEQKLRQETVLVSIQYANSEIGTIQPIRKISKLLRNFPATLFHTDASQAAPYLDCVPEHLGVHLLTIDAQKMYGPKGIGALYIKRGIKIKPIIVGGGQEHDVRAGTENVPLIMGFAKAFELVAASREKEVDRLTLIRDYGIDKILASVRGAVLNGSKMNRLPTNINISIPKLDAEFAVLKLDARGISSATKSACVSSDEASYVIAALGKGKDYSRSSLRFTLGSGTKKADMDRLYRELQKIV